MKKIAVVVVGMVVAMSPAGTAYAGGTGNGVAWGNCQNSSAGGELDPVMDSAHGRGNGGLVEVAKSGAGCVPATSTAQSTPVYDEGDQ
jgi:hypothetical protein